VFSASRSLETV
jgi:hypothetical protein